MSLEILPPLYEGRVLHVRVPAKVNTEFLTTFMNYVKTQAAASPYGRVHILADESLIEDLPSLTTFIDVAQSLDFAGSNRGWYILYGIPNRLVGMISAILANVLRLRLKIVPTYEDAIAFLNEVDDEVAHLRA
jgi:hypothetical protein